MIIRVKISSQALESWFQVRISSPDFLSIIPVFRGKREQKILKQKIVKYIVNFW